MLYYTWHIGDWRKSTARMSHLERGLYRDLLDELYDSEAPLPNSVEKLADLLGVEKASEISALRSVLKKKFVLVEGGYIQTRAWAELMAFKELREKRAKAGKEGGVSKHQRLLKQKLALAIDCHPEGQQKLASLGAISHSPDPIPHLPFAREPAVPGELAAGAGDTQEGIPPAAGEGGSSGEGASGDPEGSAPGVPASGAGVPPLLGDDGSAPGTGPSLGAGAAAPYRGEEAPPGAPDPAAEATAPWGDLPAGIEFPVSFPDSAEKAVAWVRGLMLPVGPAGLPREEWIREVWLQAAGRGCRDAVGVQITRWAHWVHSRWSKEGPAFLARGGAVVGGEKKEGGATQGARTEEAPPEGWQAMGRALFDFSWGHWAEVPEGSRVDIRRALAEAAKK